MYGALPAPLADRGRQLTVVRVQGRDKMKNYLADMGFALGTSVMVLAEDGGNIIFKLAGTKIALGKELAARIFVG